MIVNIAPVVCIDYTYLVGQSRKIYARRFISWNLIDNQMPKLIGTNDVNDAIDLVDTGGWTFPFSSNYFPCIIRTTYLNDQLNFFRNYNKYNRRSKEFPYLFVWIFIGFISASLSEVLWISHLNRNWMSVGHFVWNWFTMCYVCAIRIRHVMFTFTSFCDRLTLDFTCLSRKIQHEWRTDSQQH